MRHFAKINGLLIISLLLIAKIESGEVEGYSSTLTVADYLEEVSSNNEDVIASKQLQKSYTARAKEGSLLFSPRLVSSVSKVHQETPQLIPNFPIYLGGRDLDYRQYNIAVEQETPIGLKWRVENISNFSELSTSVNIVIPALVSLGIPIQSRSWSVAESVTLQQSLWKNGFGERTRARARGAKSQAIAEAYQEEFKLKQTISQAENVYWQLVLARALTAIRAESVEQAEKLMAHIEKKREESLVLESDVYQAQSVLNISRIDYERAKENETALALAFNSLRGISSPEVPEMLLVLSHDLIEHLTPKERGVRPDLKANEEMLKAQEAQNIVAINDLMPDLDLTATYGFTGISPHFHESLDLSFNKPAASSGVMVKLTFPLSPIKINAVKRAYRNSSRAARLNYDRMKFQHDQQWDDLMVRLQENLKLLQLLTENEEVQRCKFENAQLEYGRGLTTFFVVTNTQNDYQSSRIAILQTFETLLNILLNLGMYKGASESN